MYEIRPESVRTYLDDRKIYFPRFQRKQTWDDKKNFKLCISIFKNFPVGVVVINKEEVKGRFTKWLLDGRQRRNALIRLMDNPEEVYDWAKKFIKFKVNDQPEKIEEGFWKAIQEHLEKDEDVKENIEEESSVSSVSVNEEDDDEFSFQTDDEPEIGTFAEEEKDDELKILLQLILLVHKKDKLTSGLTRPFDFSEIIDNLPFIEQTEEGIKHNGKKLRLFILEFNKHCYDEGLESINSDDFLNYIVLKYRLNNTQIRDLKNILEQRWDRIKERLELIDKLESKLQDAIIGIIELKNASLIDAQNIFKLINSEGTQLTSEEILSSKPSWNIIIKEPSQELKEHVKELYSRLAVKNNDVVRWDFPATIVGRLKNCNYLVKELSLDKDAEFKARITLGFKIVSAIFEKGINKASVSNLAKNNSIKWKEDIEQFINDLNLMFRVISEINYFKYLKTWKTSLMEITSDAVVINFLATLYLDWVRKGKPITSDAKKFQKNAIILFDRLIYEYMTRQWRGSSDSRVASNLQNFYKQPELFLSVDKVKWEALLTEIIENNTINDTKIKKYSDLKPILIHHYCLSNQAGPDDPDVEITIDHIYPQDVFNNSPFEDKDILCNNLFNLALLPKSDNVSKGNKKLKVIDNQWLTDYIVKYTGITSEDFNKYSDINNIEYLKEKRKIDFLNSFTAKRNQIIYS
ncbi:DUF262 domain-containing protein [Fictibacillus phosphorivorans]|uniref:DUF262 domain-containing protein n=1 Tax=Fictibacillus phosphorivorans TaxID=1221500 RepID=UPI0035E99205